MNAREANVFLTKAALLDPRLKRLDAEEQASMAEAWAEVLTDVTLADANAAAVEHYSETRDVLMPVDVLTYVDAIERTRQLEQTTERLALPPAEIDPAEKAKFLAELFPDTKFGAGHE